MFSNYWAEIILFGRWGKLIVKLRPLVIKRKLNNYEVFNYFTDRSVQPTQKSPRLTITINATTSRRKQPVRLYYRTIANQREQTMKRLSPTTKK